MANNSYEVDYNDKRLTQVEAEEKAAIKESDKMYDGMINSSDSFYKDQITAVKDYGNTQSKLQQEQTDFAIEKIEQQKDQAHKDYLKEQSGAYVDYKKQSNQYGVNAEQQAQNGLAFTGYSESSQVAMYNQYQNRVATARESYNKAILEYDNMMKDARLQNSAALAEIAFNTLQTTLELSLQGFQYKNTLVLEKANAKATIGDRYYNRYQNTLSQINSEKALAEQIRQYNENLALQKQQLAEEKRQFNENLALQRAKAFNSGGGGIVYGQLDDDNKGEGDNVKGSNNSPYEISNGNGGSSIVVNGVAIPKGLMISIGVRDSVDGKQQMIQKYLDEGSLTEEQAKALLKHNGLL